MTETQALPKPKRPAMVCVLSEREATLLENHAIEPNGCGRNGHRHTRQSKASLLVRTGRYRWIRKNGEKNSQAKYIAECAPRGWQNMLNACGFTSQQMVPGGLRI